MSFVICCCFCWQIPEVISGKPTSGNLVSTRGEARESLRDTCKAESDRASETESWSEAVKRQSFRFLPRAACILF